MGQELATTLRYKRQTIGGKALLETDHVLFRGAERLKILFKDLTRVRATDGTLKLEFPGGPAELELGAAAEKWAHKILNPPSRLDKLGVKPGVAVRLEGPIDREFRKELLGSGVKETKDGGKTDLVFFAAAATAELGQVRKLTKILKPAGALWVLYPKGVTTIREVEVIETGRAAGLKDVKVCGFSSTHTALKFVIPVAARGK
jgi:hypothetical protein